MSQVWSIKENCLCVCNKSLPAAKENVLKIARVPPPHAITKSNRIPPIGIFKQEELTLQSAFVPLYLHIVQLLGAMAS